jgi:hypothetical protein
MEAQDVATSFKTFDFIRVKIGEMIGDSVLCAYSENRKHREFDSPCGKMTSWYGK